MSFPACTMICLASIIALLAYAFILGVRHGSVNADRRSAGAWEGMKQDAESFHEKRLTSLHADTKMISNQ
jgi:hypothetical protein